MIVVGLALVCVGFIFWRRRDKQNDEVDRPKEISPIEDPGIAELLARLNAVEPEMRDERSEHREPE
ncbi:hypothetical protein [Bradyrhizobium sp. Arg816]|uniref:hypothetical protein n=1 Tax=Bradyrhizobium sp. Arg816 TaxID=2998491 RepID=UPI00249E223D|nr:hypothetical protein [Bradyrhizobium sp. Arg816]MDI3567242.1 hypothetical protein [Bradyrhizobium sp. Arg816]